MDENGTSIFNDTLKTGKLESLADEIYLTNDNNEKRKLAQFRLKVGTYIAELYFPILDDKQNPFITTKTTKVTLNLKAKLWKKGFLEEVRFDFSKLSDEDKLGF